MALFYLSDDPETEAAKCIKNGSFLSKCLLWKRSYWKHNADVVQPESDPVDVSVNTSSLSYSSLL